MLILASASPRRRELLTQINCNFVCRVADCTEISPAQEKNPAKLVKQNAILKALAAVDSDKPDEIILGADTVVACGSQIYGRSARLMRTPFPCSRACPATRIRFIQASLSSVAEKFFMMLSLRTLQ